MRNVRRFLSRAKKVRLRKRRRNVHDPFYSGSGKSSWVDDIVDAIFDIFD